MLTIAYLRLELMSMDNGAFDVINISKMLKGTLKKTSLFTKLTNGNTIIVLQDVVGQNGVSNRRVHSQVHFQQASLKRWFQCDTVVDQFQQKLGTLLNSTNFRETIHNLNKEISKNKIIHTWLTSAKPLPSFPSVANLMAKATAASGLERRTWRSWKR